MRYKLFGRHTGLRVSELVLGTGNFGTRWGHGTELDEARRILDAYAEAGGNFIDTADSYQFGQSEEILGDLLQGRRDDFVVATKFTQRASPKDGILVTGNSRKAMMSSVEASLRRLKTDHIDLYWVHYSDGVTPIEEIVRGFDDLVRTGKILYAGLSDFPAWRVARAATIAELRGTVPVAGARPRHRRVVAARRRHAHRQVPAGRGRPRTGARRQGIPGGELRTAKRGARHGDHGGRRAWRRAG
jgi:aryl-alcohol dehydrogenase-like predicted oxidoreductase